MSENKQDIVVFKGGKNSNQWWISLDWSHRQIFRILIALTGGLAADSASRNILDMFQLQQISEQQLRAGASAITSTILIVSSIVYTKIVRKKTIREYEYESIKEELLRMKDAELAWDTERDLLLEKIDTLEELIMEDSLTELLNRRGTMRIIKQYSAKMKRTGGEVHILFIDLDKLKDINSEFGHTSGGDRAIQEVAQAIQRTSRKEEPGCRFGGDEFLMVIPYKNSSPHNMRETKIIEKRLIDEVGKIHILAIPIKNPTKGYKKVSVSVTVAIHILDLEKPIEDELNKASEKMLTLKKV